MENQDTIHKSIMTKRLKKAIASSICWLAGIGIVVFYSWAISSDSESLSFFEALGITTISILGVVLSVVLFVWVVDTLSEP